MEWQFLIYDVFLEWFGSSMFPSLIKPQAEPLPDNISKYVSPMFSNIDPQLDQETFHGHFWHCKVDVFRKSLMNLHSSWHCSLMVASWKQLEELTCTSILQRWNDLLHMHLCDVKEILNWYSSSVDVVSIRNQKDTCVLCRNTAAEDIAFLLDLNSNQE